jgi:hypothetical protein
MSLILPVDDVRITHMDPALLEMLDPVEPIAFDLKEAIFEKGSIP